MRALNCCRLDAGGQTGLKAELNGGERDGGSSCLLITDEVLNQAFII